MRVTMMDTMQHVRFRAAEAANAEDAGLWRWFSALLDERRIRWRYCFSEWIISVDRIRVATEPSFDRAIRSAKQVADSKGLGLRDDAR